MKSNDSSQSKKDIVRILDRLQEGYSKRNISTVSSWVNELFYEEVTILGTNGVKPGDFEWRTGLKAAEEMFENDWKNWGDVKLNLEDSEIDVEENAAWVAMQATVTRLTADSEIHSSGASRKRSLQRIKEYTERDWTSTRILYEVIHDASMILTQYERGDVFIWPIRITLGLLKKEDCWKIRQVHFSFPGRGFPNVRIEK